MCCTPPQQYKQSPDVMLLLNDDIRETKYMNRNVKFLLKRYGFAKLFEKILCGKIEKSCVQKLRNSV